MKLLEVFKKIIFILKIIIISFLLFVGILWCFDELEWNEYQSDCYKIGTVIDKTVTSNNYGSTSYVTVKYNDGMVSTYISNDRSDCPNSFILKTIAENKTYEFRIGKFIHNHYGRKKNENVENIISVKLIEN